MSVTEPMPTFDARRCSPSSAPITHLGFDFAVTLISIDEFTIRIETPFSFWDGTDVLVIRPGAAGSVAPILTLHQDELSTVELGESGSVRITFVSGCAVSVEPDDSSEAFDDSRRRPVRRPPGRWRRVLVNLRRTLIIGPTRPLWLASLNRVSAWSHRNRPRALTDPQSDGVRGLGTLR